MSEEALAGNPSRRRLAYDELLASQLALALVRSRMRRLPGRQNAGDGALVRTIEQALPFALTGAQRRAVEDIRRDLVSDKRMLRLLQGDVGSGKTAVALLAMASAIEAGRQAALMAPTEILARQHFDRIEPLARAAGLRVALLTGRDRGAARRATLLRLAEGAIPIVVGTHALFQEDVAFRDLGLAVVDEQHRFGVHQRLALGDQGRGGRHPGHDRDADPAHPRAHLFRRHGPVRARREAARPPADHDAARVERSARGGHRRRRPGGRGGRSGLLGLSAGGRIRIGRSRRRRGPL